VSASVAQSGSAAASTRSRTMDDSSTRLSSPSARPATATAAGHVDAPPYARTGEHLKWRPRVRGYTRQCASRPGRRHSEVEAGADAFTGIVPYAPAPPLHDLLHNSEPETRALHVRPHTVEALEHPGPGLCRDADAVVLDRHRPGIARLLPTRRNTDPPFRLRGIRVADPVPDEVRQRELQCTTIDGELHGRHVDRDLDAERPGIVLDPLADRRQRRVQPHRLRTFPTCRPVDHGQGEEVVDQVCYPRRVPKDDLLVAPPLLLVPEDRVLAEKRRGALDRAERALQLVAHHPVEAPEPVGVFADLRPIAIEVRARRR